MFRHAFLAMALAASCLPGQSPPGSEEGAVRIDGRPYPYRLLLPDSAARGAPLPLVVFLHGAGERGDDNRASWRWLPEVLDGAEGRQRWPCFALAVQCPHDAQWVDVPWGDPVGGPFPDEPTPALRAVLAALDAVLAAHPVDRARIYLTGLSMGGYGAFDLAARAPERFAAVLAICGGGDAGRVHRFVGLPFSIWHGDADPVVPVARSRQMVAALRAFGAPVDVHEVPGAGHDVWRQAYRAGAGLDWLFAQDQRQQDRAVGAGWPLVPAADTFQPGDGTFELRPGARCVATGAAVLPATALAAALAALGGPRLDVVEPPGRDGDVEFVVEPRLVAPIVLDAARRFRVVARAPEALPGAAVAAWQALQQLPGGGCAAGTARMRPRPVGAVVRLEVGEPWTRAGLEHLVAAAWVGGAVRLEAADLDTLAWLPPPERAPVFALARACGVALAAPAAAVGAAEPGAPAALPDVVALLRAEPAPAAGPLLLRLPASPPATTLAAVWTRLPAVVARAAGGPPSAAVLLGRIGRWLRGSV